MKKLTDIIFRKEKGFALNLYLNDELFICDVLCVLQRTLTKYSELEPEEVSMSVASTSNVHF